MQTILRAEKLFTGEDWLYNQQIVIEDGIIRSVTPDPETPFVSNNAPSFLAPAFIDFQVYGAAQKLLAVYPQAETLQVMYDVFSREGTCLFQPTVATNTPEVFHRSIDAVRAYWQGGGKGVAGLHLEGPWLHPARRGAHIESLIHSPTVKEVEELLAYGEGIIKTITIAPEVCSDEVLQLLLSSDIILSAGHSNATYRQATESFDKGIPTVTHMFNAMSPLHHREPGLVGAALQHKSVLASIIPDGHHVAFAAIRIAKSLMGDRLFAITDAVTETAEGAYRHHRVGNKYECNGTLSGSAISMYDAFYNLVKNVGIEVEEALRMCSLYPARALRMAHFYGKIAPGFAAQFVVLNKQLEVVENPTW
ncbi:MAG TPA: N-acetylglucosamine-6-phosphate deacetylase [Flavisolibacter sp.]|jgi:N-acetylglucosamine-6-phosphate deacetylase|nr:N-acetylglucosamine-6-phosphate deacetylase [Flavisolibacter sp.]